MSSPYGTSSIVRNYQKNDNWARSQETQTGMDNVVMWLEESLPSHYSLSTWKLGDPPLLASEAGIQVWESLVACHLRMLADGRVELGRVGFVLPRVPIPTVPPALVPGGDSRDLILGLLFGQQRNLSPCGPALIQTPALLHLAPKFTVMRTMFWRTQRL